MRPFLALATGIDRINEFIGRAAAWLILLAVLVSAINAVVRKTLNISSNAWLELQWYLFGAAFLLAAAYTLKRNEHVRVDVLYGMLSRRTQNRIDLAGHLLFLMPFVGVMLWLLVPYAGRAMCLPGFVRADITCRWAVSANAGGLLIWPAKLLLLLGFALLFLQGASEIIKKIAILSGRMDDPVTFLTQHQAAELEASALARELAGEEGPPDDPERPEGRP